MHYRSLLSVASLFAACACGGSPTAASQTPPPSAGTSIGSTGGTVMSSDGRARLDVPAGALGSPVTFTVQPATNMPLDPAAVGQSAYEIVPAGVTFQVAARFRLTYLPNLRPSGTAESDLRLHRLSGGGWTMDAVSPETDEVANAVSANITATGAYAARWPDPTTACELPEDRQFDFWLGEWTFSQTRPVTSSGVNSITRDAMGCRILENFNTGRGRSVSFFSRLDQQWHQTYIDTDGNRLVMAGVFDGIRMQLYSSPGGRWSWEPVDGTQVRYFGESLSGGAWTVTFDSRYVAR